MEIRQFTYVHMVAECGSITKAAARLFITQPALSNYINKLEEELGVRLFDRSTSPLRPTLAGEQYLRHARAILLQIEDMNRELRDISDNRTGRLRIGFPNERIIYMLPRLMPAFQAQFPNVRIEVQNGSGKQLLAALKEGDVDFVFLPRWNPTKGMKQFRVSEEELVLVAAKGYLDNRYILDQERSVFNWGLIGELPLLTLEKGHALRESVDALLSGTGRQANVFLESHSNMLSCRLAAARMGVAVVPEITLELVGETVRGRLEKYHLAQCPVTWDVCAIYREEAYLGIIETSFLNLAHTLFGHG